MKTGKVPQFILRKPDIGPPPPNHEAKGL
jgi:hypothetical protein